MPPARPSVPSSSSGFRFAHTLTRGMWKVVVLYGVLGLLWIVFSDGLIANLAPNVAIATRVQTYKGVLFVLLTTTLLVALLRPLMRHVVETHDKLSTTAANYRHMFHGNAGPMLVYDVDTLRILDVNSAAVAFFGWPHDDFLRMTLDQLLPEDQRDAMGRIMDEVRSDPEQARTVSTWMHTHDGQRRLMEVRGNAIDYGGARARLIIAIDRSAEAQAQGRRDRALARLEEAHEIARIGAWELDPATGLGMFSDQVYALLGRRPPAAPTWQRPDEILLPYDASTAAQTTQLIADMRSGRNVQIDVLLPLLAVDGHMVTAHLRAESGVGEDGQPRIHGTLQDVTEREQSRRLLREREEQFRELVRVMPDGVVILAGGHVAYVNSVGAAQFGSSGPALLGEPLSTLVDEGDLAQVTTHLETRSIRRDGTTIQARMRRADGSVFHASLADGEVRYGGRDCKLLIVRDLSEPERIRDALETSNGELQAMARRLFSLQEDERKAISRDLHDDIGQAITAMKLSAHAALDEPEASRRNEDLQQIVSLADSTITKLRNLSMLLRPPQLDALGLEAALRWQAGMLFRSSAVELIPEIETLPQRPSGEIEQACFRIAQESLTNVLRHASAGQVRLHLEDEDGQYLRLRVSDDGDGFDPEGPRGLGLIVMRERAQTAGGTLQITSSPGAGTLVDLRLPYRLVPTPAAGSTES